MQFQVKERLLFHSEIVPSLRYCPSPIEQGSFSTLFLSLHFNDLTAGCILATAELFINLSYQQRIYNEENNFIIPFYWVLISKLCE